MPKKALKDLPLQEISLRKYEEPKGLGREELIKKFCLSIGLLQPGESRDIVVNILSILLEARKTQQALTIPQLLEKLRGRKGTSASNIRRQLRRLKALKLVEKVPEGYRITEFGRIEPIVNDFIIQFIVNPSIERIKEYSRRLDENA